MKRLFLLIPILFAAAPACSTAPSTTLTYTVTGSNGATQANIVTYQVSVGETQDQLTNVILPWSITFAASKGDPLYLSAQDPNNAGCLTASVLNGTTTLATDSECGASADATATGTF